MITCEEFSKTLKWIVILAAITFLHNTKADNENYETNLKFEKIELQLTRWFKKVVEKTFLSTIEEGRLITDYGQRNKQLIPTLAAADKLYYLPRSIRKYHLAILKQATSMTTSRAGIAILIIKYLAVFHAVNYTNCALYIKHHSLPNIRYCKEVALLFFDLVLMGTDVLCSKLAEFYSDISDKNVFLNFSKALNKFEKKFRRKLENIESTVKNFINHTDFLHEHVLHGVSDYFLLKLCYNEDQILKAVMRDLGKFFGSITLDKPLPRIKGVAQNPLRKAIEVWLQAESTYENSLDPSSDEVDLMKLLFNSEIIVAEEFKYFDENAIHDLKLLQGGDFIIDEESPDNKIVVKFKE